MVAAVRIADSVTAEDVDNILNYLKHPYATDRFIVRFDNGKVRVTADKGWQLDGTLIRLGE